MNLTPEQKEEVLGFLARMKKRASIALVLLGAENNPGEDFTFEHSLGQGEFEADFRTIELLEKVVGEK